MAAPRSTIKFPQMSLTMVQRVSATLPVNHFLFRCDPSYTKWEIKEYLEKLYSVKIARMTTSIVQGKWKARRGLRASYFKTKDYKRVMVMLANPNYKIEPLSSEKQFVDVSEEDVEGGLKSAGATILTLNKDITDTPEPEAPTTKKRGFFAKDPEMLR